MDVFKYLKQVNNHIKEGAADDAREMGLEYAGYGKWKDPKTGQVTHKSVKSAGQTTLQQLDAKEEPQKQDKKPEEKKTLSGFKKDAKQEAPKRMDLSVAKDADPEKTAEYSAMAASQGMWPHFSDERKQYHIDQQKAMAAAAEAEAEAAAAAEQEKAALEQPPEEPKEKTIKDFRSVKDVEKENEELKTEKTSAEVNALMSEDPTPENIADVQDTMLELRKLAGKQATEAVQKSEAKYAKYMDKVFKPFEDLVSKMDDQKKNSFIPLVANAHKFTGRSNNGAGLNSLGQFDVKQLALGKDRMFKNYDFDDKESVEKYVRSVRGNEVDDELVDATFEILPKKLKSTWAKKGMAGKGELGKNHFLGYDEDGNELRGSGGVDRAKYVWRMYLEQGGVDAYTGLPLNIDNIDLEHIRPASKAEGDLEEFKTREHEKNWVLVNANVNQAKSDLSMKEFFEKQVDPLAAKEDDYWKTRSDIFDYRNSIPSKEAELMSSFVDKDGKIVDGMSGEIFMEMMENHEAGLKRTKKELGVGADASGDKEIKDAWKSIETQSKLAKELITALGLPRGYNKQKNVEGSKPRSNSMGSDNYYRGVFLSMVGKSPEEQERIKSTYRDAIRHAEDSGGGDASFADYMVQNGGVDMERISKYKALGKMFKSLQESLTYFGKSFIFKHRKS